MKEMNDMSSIKIQDLENEFLKIMKSLTDVFGKRNFRIYDEYTRGRINIAVMESVYSSICYATSKHINISKEDLIRRYEKMIHDHDYLFSVRNSTGSKSKVIDRFRIAKEYILGKV